MDGIQISLDGAQTAAAMAPVLWWMEPKLQKMDSKRLRMELNFWMDGIRTLWKRAPSGRISAPNDGRWTPDVGKLAASGVFDRKGHDVKPGWWSLG